MAFHSEEPQDQVLAACIAVVYVLDASKSTWKAVVDEGAFSNVQLIQSRQNAFYRVRGRLLSNGQIVIDVLLEKDVAYEINSLDKSCHTLTSSNNVFLLKLRADSPGDQFAVVVRNILRRLQWQENPSSPRDAWMPVSATPKSNPQPKPAKEQLLNSPNLGNKNPFRPQTFFQAQNLHPTQSTHQTLNSSSVTGHSLSSAPTLATPPRGNQMHYFGVDELCDKLSFAIQEGNVESAEEISKSMAEQRLSLSIKQKNPKIIAVNVGEDSFNLRVVVEDRETSGGAFAMKVSPTTTVAQLEEEVAERYGFPPKVQKWISGMKMAKPHETMADLNIKRKGCTAYLYLVDGKKVGLKRQDFEHYLNKQEERKKAGLGLFLERNASETQPHVASLSGSQLSRTTSLPSLTTIERSTMSTGFSNTVSTMPGGILRDPQTINPKEFSGSFVLQGRLYSPTSIEDLQKMLEGLGNEPSIAQTPNTAVAESQVGWTCQTCTFVNIPTRPGCEICGGNRPEDYEIPQNPQITEQERLRLEKEQQETEMFRRTLDRQEEEQDQARQVNFRQLMEAAQQNLISNKEEFDCAICFLTVQPGEGVMLRECLHCFCRDCLREHIRNCTDPEVQCPFQDNDFACHFVITTQEIKALLSQEDFNKFLNRSLATAESQAPNSFHCKTPNCPGWCIYEDNTNVFHCPVCNKVNCLTCKAIHHPEMNCKEYQEDLKRRAENDVAAEQTQKFLEEMITKGEAMKCPQCAIILLKKDGCDWMRCSMCKLEICWATRGPRWGPQGVGDLSGGCKCRANGKKCHPKCRNCH